MNNRDIIYIDVDDDITSLIRKLDGTKRSIVALVAPKHSTVLQSAVNLKLLKRKAESKKRNVVLVTSDKASVALAGSVGMYVAKNLQSKPEIPTISSVMEDESDVIVADELPGSKTTPTPTAKKSASSDEITESDLSKLNPAVDNPGLKINDKVAEQNNKKPGKKKSKTPKVPNFDSFRKKALLIGGGVLLLIIGVIVFMTINGHTTVTIHGETSSEDLNFDLTATTSVEKSNPKARTIKATSAEIQKTVSQTFSATGEKNMGQKASGQISFSMPCSAILDGFPTIPAGTQVTARQVSFTTQASAEISSNADTSSGSCRFSSNSVGVIATKPGGSSNIAASDSYSVSGFSAITGSGGQMSGGTDNIVKIITQGDVDKARASMKTLDDSAVQNELNNRFDKDLRILEDSFTKTPGAITITPDVGDQASQGTVTAQYTYSKLAISNDDLNAVLDSLLQSKIKDKNTQRIYKNGFDSIKLNLASKADPSTVSYKVSTVGHIGPQFDEDYLRRQITDKKHGQIVSILQQVPGVSSVDVSISPFWVSKSGPPTRITINLDINKINSSGEE